MSMRPLCSVIIKVNFSSRTGAVVSHRLCLLRQCYLQCLWLGSEPLGVWVGQADRPVLSALCCPEALLQSTGTTGAQQPACRDLP